MARDEKALPAPKAEERLAPEEWAKRRGHVRGANVARNEVLGTGPHLSPEHCAADAMHCWSWHAAQYQAEPLLITEADYVTAIDAANPREGQPKRHAPAASPHAPDLPAAHR